MQSTHTLLDRRSLQLHRLIAQRLRQSPEKLDGVRRTLAHWRAMDDPHSRRYMAQWQRALDIGLDALLAIAVEESERADALRQCSPLGCVLTPRERWAFFRQWSQNHAAL